MCEVRDRNVLRNANYLQIKQTRLKQNYHKTPFEVLNIRIVSKPQRTNCGGGDESRIALNVD
jgi:hypothetical protein